VGRAERAVLELRFADLVLNEATREVSRGEALVDLTPTEFNLLRYFLMNPRRVLTKQEILDRVWAADFAGDANIVETYVGYLRRKLDPLGPRLIHTVRLVGYALRESDT
jgi:two-component system, OmpR family, response regulator